MKGYMRLGIGTCFFAAVLLCTSPDKVRAEEKESVTKEIHHIHKGDAKEGTGCYKEAVNHVHTGSAETEGGCYTVPIFHVHTGDSLTGGGCYKEEVCHVHSGSPQTGGACYTIPVRHVHSGTAVTGGGCYGVPVYHVHSGSEGSGGACYEPVYHQHTDACYVTENCIIIYMGNLQILRTQNDYCSHHGNTQFAQISGHYSHSACGAGITSENHYMCWTCQHFNKSHSYQRVVCTKNEGTIEGYRLVCTKGAQTVDAWTLGCGKTELVAESYQNSCGKTEKSIDSYKRSCGKDEKSIDAYALGCKKTKDTIEHYVRNCGREEEMVYALLTITNGNSGWTAKPKELKASCIELEKGGLLQWEEPRFLWEKDGVKEGEGDSIAASENGSYTVKLQVRNEDIDPSELSLSIYVEKVDTTAPIIESAYYDSEDNMVRISAKDLQPDGSEGSGLADKAYSYDRGITWDVKGEKEIGEADEKELGEEKILTVAVRDACGNIAEKTLIIQKNKAEEILPEEPKEETPEEPKEETERNEKEGNNGDNKNEGNNGGGSSKNNSGGDREDKAINVENREKEKPQTGSRPIEIPKKNRAGSTGTAIKKETPPQDKNLAKPLTKKLPKLQKEEETKNQESLAAAPMAEEIEIQTIKDKNTSTPVIKAAAFTVGSVIGTAGILWLMYLLLGTIRIYHSDGEEKLRYAGSCIVKKKEDGFEVTIPRMILEQSNTGQYSLRPGRLFTGRNKGKELLVTAGGQKISVWIDEEMPLRLPTYV
ncbi:hypothetical protein EDD76_10213 [Kineothrix alysoides]|uniref:Uncharacterized protein n=1 Tax=Kineothrix alysoides TaxID=1469948 RepID=A0A4R1R4E6_9FIRM|nr:hypothetical protein [Kineothrix alysoides]TCL60319.1 hypothetical protein EDD76_10213 [Kineothrix alysoides]